MRYEGTGEVEHGFVGGVYDHLDFSSAGGLFLRLQARAQGGANDASVVCRDGKEHGDDGCNVGRIEKWLVAVNVQNKLARLGQQPLNLP